mgnify:CR=1 FL=1|jgi:hypothetical protein
MKRIEVKLSVDVVAPLLDVVRETADTLRDTVSPAVRTDDMDLEMREAWVEDLLAGQRSDLDVLLGLFGDEFFKDGSIVFDSENADAVLRASAAVRLHLRSHGLQGVDEEQLESGAVEIESLPEAARRPFVCYLFLATLQELIIQHLNPASPEI